MTMHLLPVYFSTTNTSIKRKKSKKPKSLLKAEANHKKFLDKIRGCSSFGRASALQAEGSRFDPVHLHHRIPDLPPLSDVIPVGVAPKKKLINHNFTIAPAYNKGAYQVITKDNIKDIGK